MARRLEQSFRKRKPAIFLVCEGRNKTETLYFNHFKNRDSGYNLYIKGCESTDIKNIADKAAKVYTDNGIDRSAGEHVFCVVDLDLDPDKLKKYEAVKKKYKNIEFIVSNPCFEIWLLYYFTESPKRVDSSQEVKNLMKKYVAEYSENMDVVEKMKLQDKYSTAINRSELKNISYVANNIKFIDRNPYTEVQDIIEILQQLSINS